MVAVRASKVAASLSGTGLRQQRDDLAHFYRATASRPSCHRQGAGRVIRMLHATFAIRRVDFPKQIYRSWGKGYRMKLRMIILAKSKYFFALVALFSASVANAEYVICVPVDTQSSSVGIYVRMPPGSLTSTVCATTEGNWLIIPASQQILIAHYLSLNARAASARFYFNGSKDALGYCYVTDIADH